MTSASAFLQTLREDPGDRTTLLVFADWLTDQDDPLLAGRGELIRIQAELARWVPDVEPRESLQRREQEVLDLHTDEWLAPVLPFCRSWEVRNGLASITLTAKNFLQGPLAWEAETLLAEAWVFALRLVECSPAQAVLLARCEALRLLTGLDLSGNGLDDGAIHSLTRSPWLSNLRVLDLSNNQISASGLQDLLLSRFLRRLPWLELHGNDLEPGWSATLAALRHRQDPGGSLPGRPLYAGPRLVNSIDMELTLIPAGSFRMGSPETEVASERSANGPAGADERPQHLVTITSAFYLGVYPVTQRQYETVMGNNPAEFNSSNRGGPDHPVERVSWEDAQRFCERLSELPREREAGRIYRLPTEAEWEHACRAGTGTPFWWGESASIHQANFHGEKPYGNVPGGVYLARTTRVGSYQANPFGLYDVHGNVWEWVQDFYDPGYYAKGPGHDPLGPSEGDRKCARGGSWNNAASDCRSACRDYWYGISYAPNNIGFRVAMTVSR